MRFNDYEIGKHSKETEATIEGVLNHLKPMGKDWSDWYQQATFKERYFKLVANLLFSYRVKEPDPIGVLVLENAQIAYERPNHKELPFAFSITFHSTNKLEASTKHIFSCRCDADVSKWVSALKTSSYEYWRSQYLILRAKISMKTCTDPVLDYMKNNANYPKIYKNVAEPKSKNKSKFYSDLDNSPNNDESCQSNASGADLMTF